MPNTVLELKNVSKKFGKVPIVEDISLSVNEGEIFGLLGPNGAGKTTTIKMILGMLSIDKGQILINGFDVKKQFEKAMGYVGGIVENPDLYGYMSAVQNLKMFAKIRGVDYSRVYKCLDLVGLEKSKDQKVSKYSLGMKQRAGLALSIIHEPKLLILDEPTNGLDPAGIKELRDILKKLAKENHTAIFVSSHILSEMQQLCDRVCFINKGKVVKIEELTETENSKNQSNYAIKANNLEEAKKVVKEKLGKEAIIKDSKLYIELEDNEIANVVKALVTNNIDVTYVNKESSSLEEMFFDVTKEGK